MVVNIIYLFLYVDVIFDPQFKLYSITYRSTLVHKRKQASLVASKDKDALEVSVGKKRKNGWLERIKDLNAHILSKTQLELDRFLMKEMHQYMPRFHILAW